LTLTSYAVFEDEKIITYLPGQDSDIGKHCFKLRHLFIWNKSSKRRTCGVAWTSNIEISTVECCRAILSRWGASENTFKHTLERHPLHYHPGFKLIKSDNQEIKNPLIKEKDKLIKGYKTKVGKLYKKLANSKDVLNKDGSPRQNSVKERIKKEIQEHEYKLKILKQEKNEIPERINVSSLENYKSLNPDCFAFAFVRNPWDRVVSTYFYLKNGGDREEDREDVERYLPYDNFRSFVLDGFKAGKIFNQLHFRPQYQWLSKDGNLVVDSIGRFENLQNNFSRFCRLFRIPNYKLPHLNKTRREYFRNYYDADTWEVIYLAYRKDVELFGDDPRY